MNYFVDLDEWARTVVFGEANSTPYEYMVGTRIEGKATLPDTAIIVGASFCAFRRGIVITFADESFWPVADGDEIPRGPAIEVRKIVLRRQPDGTFIEPQLNCEE